MAAEAWEVEAALFVGLGGDSRLLGNIELAEVPAEHQAGLAIKGGY